MAVQRQGNVNPEVEGDIEKLIDINRKQEKRIQALETKALYIINLHFMFQGVILSSISSASPVKCDQWWIPFCLSFLAAILNLFSVSSTIRLLLKYSERLDQNNEDIQRLRESERVNERVTGKEMTGAQGREVELPRLRQLEKIGAKENEVKPRSPVRENEGVKGTEITRGQVTDRKPGSSRYENERIKRTEPDPCQQLKRQILYYTAIGLLFVFSVIMLYSCWALPCDVPNCKRLNLVDSGHRI